MIYLFPICTIALLSVLFLALFHPALGANMPKPTYIEPEDLKE